MFVGKRVGLLLLVTLLHNPVASAQQDNSTSQHQGNSIHLDVVVTQKSGSPVTDLSQQDFTVLDNKAPVTVDSFQALGGSRAPIGVILVVDDVDTGIEQIAYERSEMNKFLRIDGGHLPHPTALAFLTDSGIKLGDEFSDDGNALSAELDKHSIGLHSIVRSGGVYSAIERFQVSLDSLSQLATRESSRPGRKIILWISPGWPLLSGPGVEEQLNTKQQLQIFNQVVGLSTLLRQGRITLYSIDPLGSGDFLGAFRWEGFVKGISKPSQTDWGDLALQVIATQSGGLAVNTSNNVAALLQKCMADTKAYYEISFAPAVDQKRDEYHHLEVLVAKAGVVARTRQGYYSQP
jgi:VWFA-related protein